MQKPLTTIPQTSAHLGRQLKCKQRENRQKAVCTVRGKTSIARFAEGAMATTLVADDAPAVSAAPVSLTSSPGEEQTRSMEVDDGDEGQPPASPVSHREDELLTGGGAVGVEGEMANLTVSFPRGRMALTRVPPFRRPFPSAWPPPTYLREALLANASRMSMKGPEPLRWKSRRRRYLAQ